MDCIDTIVIILPSSNSLQGRLQGLSAFSIIRTIRFYEFTLRTGLWPSWNLWCRWLPTPCLNSLLNLAYALLGYQIIAETLNSGVLEPRRNLGNFGWAYLTGFKYLPFLTTPMYCESSAGPWSTLYVIILLIIGNFILLNLFIAILLESFMQKDEDEEEDLSLLERSLTFSKQ